MGTASATATNLMWSFVGLVLVLAGGAVIVVTAAKTVSSFRRHGDTASAETWKILINGLGISAILIGPGAFAIIRTLGKVAADFGFG